MKKRQVDEPDQNVAIAHVGPGKYAVYQLPPGINTPEEVAEELGLPSGWPVVVGTLEAKPIAGSSVDEIKAKAAYEAVENEHTQTCNWLKRRIAYYESLGEDFSLERALCNELLLALQENEHLTNKPEVWKEGVDD